MPDIINICGQEWEVEENTQFCFDDQKLGQTRHAFNKILINPNQSDTMKKDTLWHEINHVILWSIGLDKRIEDNTTSPEDVVRSITTIQLAVLQDNQELIKYLI